MSTRRQIRHDRDHGVDSPVHERLFGAAALALIRKNWPQLRTISVKFKAPFANITGITTDEQSLPLCRLRDIGYASAWGFAPYRASHDDYAESYYPDGSATGTPEDALTAGCRLYLSQTRKPTPDELTKITTWRNRYLR